MVMIIKTQTERFEHKNQIVLEILPLYGLHSRARSIQLLLEALTMMIASVLLLQKKGNNDVFFVAFSQDFTVYFTPKNYVFELLWYNSAACCMCKIKLREDKALLVFAR